MVLVVIKDSGRIREFDDYQFIVKQFITYPFFWGLSLIPWLVYKLIQSWYFSFRKGGLTGLGRRLLFTLLPPFALLTTAYYLSVSVQYGETYDYEWDQSFYNAQNHVNYLHREDQKLRSIHVFSRLDSQAVSDIVKANIEQVVLVPYAYQEDTSTPNLKFLVQHFSDSNHTYHRILKLCQSLGLEVILKPHIWITNPENGKWRADIAMNSESEWIAWEERYTQFILQYARLSEAMQLPYFCIGNEYYVSTTQRPMFWRKLIKKVRKAYSGKLVYGANWDREYEEISFWDDLDYIGIQAYFPVSQIENPAREDLKDKWKTHLKSIREISERYDKKVIFTELGYRSAPNAGVRPWEWEDHLGDFFRPVSLKTQALCYEAFFEQVWYQKWIAGVFIWKWQSSTDLDHTFSIRSKPAYNEIAKGFMLKER